MASRRRTTKEKGAHPRKRRRQTTRRRRPAVRQPQKKAKNQPKKAPEKRLPSKKTKSINESSSSNILIDNIMPVQNSVPPTLDHPVKKRKADRTLHFLSRIAEKVFSEKFENFVEKFLNRSP
jgi:hypothetical protein